MAYDQHLAERVRGVIGDHPALTERKMFGGLAFMLAGNVAVGIVGDDLMVRAAPGDWLTLLEKPHAREMDFTGRPMRGWLFIAPEGTAGDRSLAEWVERGMEFALSLPPK